MEIPESLERVGAGDVRVEYKERRVVLAEDVTSESERSGSAEGFGLDAKVDGDAELFFGLFQHGDHDFGTVVDCEDNVLDAGLDEGFDLVETGRRRGGSVLEVSECLDMVVVTG
jgi:hypothetical protein